MLVNLLYPCNFKKAAFVESRCDSETKPDIIVKSISVTIFSRNGFFVGKVDDPLKARCFLV